MTEPGVSVPPYEALGGGAAVRQAVDLFYDRVLGDDRLAGYFAGADLPALRRHQVLLVSQLLGGPAAYDGRDLRTAHAGLGITPEHYALVGEYLLGVLGELGAPPEAVATVSDALVAVRGDVLGSGTAD